MERRPVVRAVIFSGRCKCAAHYRAAERPVNQTAVLSSISCRLTACGRALDFAQSPLARERIASNVLRPARYQRNPQGMEGRESRAAVGKREGASPCASAGSRTPMVMAKDPAAALCL